MDYLFFFQLLNYYPKVPLILSGYEVPPGTLVFMPMPIVAKMNQNFVDADKFQPERFLRSEDKDQKDHHAFAHLPFGHGDSPKNSRH